MHQLATIPAYLSDHGANGNNIPLDIIQQVQNTLQKRNTGRVSLFTPDRAVIILDCIMDGQTIAQACKQAGIDRNTLYTWQHLVPGFRDMVTQARKHQAESMADDGVTELAAVDVENADPKQAMALLRRAEQVTRFKFDLAKCYNSDLYNPASKNINVNLNANVSDEDVSKWFNR